MTEKPIGERNYEQFARRYAKYAEVKPHNALYERPATLSILPDVKGKRVLDAGCGPGLYAEILLEQGAEVVAADVTPAMVQIARERVGKGAAEFHVADFAKPLTFAEDASFDLVVAPLMLDYIEDWDSVFREFFRVLRSGGHLVYSHAHPMSDYKLVQTKHNPSSRYPELERFRSDWGGFGNPRPTIETHRRPLQQMLNPMAQAGFAMEHILEPMPTKAMALVNPKLHATLTREPCFLCIRARKP